MSQPSCPHCCLKLFQPFLLPALCFYYTQPLITVRLSSLTARGAIVCSAPSLWITRLSRSSDAPHAKLHLPVPFNKTGQGVWRERERDRVKATVSLHVFLPDGRLFLILSGWCVIRESVLEVEAKDQTLQQQAAAGASLAAADRRG